MPKRARESAACALRELAGLEYPALDAHSGEERSRRREPDEYDRGNARGGVKYRREVTSEQNQEAYCGADGRDYPGPFHAALHENRRPHEKAN